MEEKVCKYRSLFLYEFVKENSVGIDGSWRR